MPMSTLILAKQSKLRLKELQEMKKDLSALTSRVNKLPDIQGTAGIKAALKRAKAKLKIMEANLVEDSCDL